MIALRRWLACVVLVAEATWAQPEVGLERVVGSGDPVPGAPGEVLLEVRLAQLAGEWIAARAYSANESGLYAWRGSDGFLVASRTTALPGIPLGAQLNIGFPIAYDVDVDGTVVIAVSWFLPSDPDTEGAGVWAWKDGQFETIVLTGDTVSGSSQPFFAAGSPLVHAGRLFFRAGEGPLGASKVLYTWSRETGVSRVVGGAGLQIMDSFEPGQRLVFNAFAGPAPGEFGIWSTQLDGSDVRREFDPESQFPDAPPGSTFRLISAGLPSLAGSPVHFLAEAREHPSFQWLFRLTGPDQLEEILRQDDLDPTSDLPHSGVFPPGLAGFGDNLAFMLRDPTQVSTLGRRLIVRDGAGEYHLIAAEGRDFEGAPVGLIEFMHGAMDGDRLAFNVLRPGDGAVWIADFGAGAPSVLEVPTLETWALAALALGLLVAASRVLRRRVL
jgi:hypothetical protein